MDVVVTGIGLVSALGTLETSWKRLLSGESGIERDQPFLELERRPLALIGAKPADLITLIRQVLADALQDANLILPLPDCGIAIGSSRGFQANLEQLASVGIRHSEEERGKKEEKEERGQGITDSRLPITDYRFSIREFFASHGGDGGGEGYWLDEAGAGADGCLCRRAYSRSPVLLI